VGDPVRPALAIIVVAYNNAGDISSCLEAAVAQLPADGSEVVVLDNCSVDDTPGVVTRAFPTVRVIRSEENLGFARGCNLAASKVDSQHLLLLNPDAVMADGCVDALLELASRRPRAGLYGGRALDRHGNFDPKSCWGRPTLWSLFCFATGLSSAFASSRWLNPEGIGGWRRDDEREVDIVSGCLLLVQHDVWERLGGFDERFFMYGEDADLAIRAGSLGARPAITPRAVVQHEVGASSGALDKHLLLYRGKATLVRKLWTGPARQLALGLLLAGVALRSTLATAARRLLRRDGDAGTTPEVWGQLWTRRRDWVEGWFGGGGRFPSDATAVPRSSRDQ
jgi:GT2 family glycosyltransferase